MPRNYQPVKQRKTRSAPRGDRLTPYRLAGLSDVEIIGLIAAYIQRTAIDGRPISANTYERTRPPELPSMVTIRAAREISWNQCVVAAGLTPRARKGGSKRGSKRGSRRRAEPAPARKKRRSGESKRSIVKTLRFSPAETAEIQASADAADLPVSQYIRRRLGLED